MRNKITAHTTPAYVCARIRKILAAQGWPLHKMSGRYAAYFNAQTGTGGYSVTKLGCSKTVTVSYRAPYGNGRSIDLPHGVAAQKVADAVALLRGRGYRIDDRGWIDCDHNDLYQ
jgi:hypothetical protein